MTVTPRLGLPRPESNEAMNRANNNDLINKLDEVCALDSESVKHSLATAASDFLVASGTGVFVKKTLAEVKAILGLGSAAYTESAAYAAAAKGVTNGDSHDHSGGDGAAITWDNVTGKPASFGELWLSDAAPIESPDGNRTVFTVPSNTKIRIYVNGLRRKPGGVDYTRASTTTITFAWAPSSGDTILLDYVAG